MSHPQSTLKLHLTVKANDLNKVEEILQKELESHFLMQ